MLRGTVFSQKIAKASDIAIFSVDHGEKAKLKLFFSATDRTDR
jgi:hypothetical protein